MIVKEVKILGAGHTLISYKGCATQYKSVILISLSNTVLYDRTERQTERGLLHSDEVLTIK